MTLADAVVPGATYGRWTVLRPVAARYNHHAYVRARCACGLERDVSAQQLRAGGTRSCRACSRRRYEHPEPGQRFGDWTVLGQAKTRPRADGRGVWHFVTCRCRCGRVRELRELSLVSGHTKRCQGCSSWGASMAREKRRAAS